ncbi:MAG: hypothetical protein VSS75_015455 [Candidatus Parabeggiatoa sp.]|nr:hypothetical protein [Candidatus Parabeggiatoa sp.]
MTDIDIENYPLDGESILLDQITCYVEGIEDVHFWKDIFDSFAPERIEAKPLEMEIRHHPNPVNPRSQSTYETLY